MFFQAYFHLWHLPITFLAGLIGEGYGSVIGSGGILIQFTLALLGLPLQHVIATDIAGSYGGCVGVLSESRGNKWNHKRILVFSALSFLVGGIVGTYFLLHIKASLLRHVVMGGLATLLLGMIVDRGYSTHPSNPLKLHWSRQALLLPAVFFVGIYQNAIGVGSGTFLAILLIGIFRMSVVESMVWGSAIGLPAGIFSFIATAISGFIAWPYFVALLVGSFVGGRYAVKIARKIPDHYLRWFLMLVTTLYLFYLAV